MARKAKTVPPEVGSIIAQAMKADRETKAAMFAEYSAPPWNLSRDVIYKIARDGGWSSNRQPRCDRGQIKISGLTKESIEKAASLLLGTSRHKTGKRLMPTKTLKEQCQLNGDFALAGASESTINRQLRRYGLNHKELLAGNPAVEMRSEYPNHIHFVDASICVQWDLKGGKKMIPRDMKKSFYKNKPGYWKTVKMVLVRWLLVDHCSGAFYVEYTYAAGENAADLINVMLNGWSEKPDIDPRYAFHGVPAMIGLDPGAAQTSHAAMKLFERLGIEPYVHSPGNSRASGCVETVHNFWEQNFECELLLKQADSLEELNARAHDRMVFLNAARTHSRHGLSRTAKWMTILASQLRKLPPKAHCMKLATSAPETRVPDQRLRIRFENAEYQLYAPALKGRQVVLDHNPWQEGEINVRTSTGEAVPCYRIEFDQHGFDNQAPVFGRGNYVRHADTPAEALRKQVKEKGKSPVVPGFEPKPSTLLLPEHHCMPRRGSAIVLDSLPPEPAVKASEVAGHVRRALSIPRISPEQHAQLQAKLQERDLVTPAELDGLITWARSAWAEYIPGARPEPFATPTHYAPQEAPCQEDHPSPSSNLLPPSAARAS